MYDGYDVEVAGDTISDIRLSAAPCRASGQHDRVIDLSGRILCPGLIDIHTHGVMGVGYSHVAESIDAATDYLARHGVTSFLPTVGQPPYEEMRENVAKLRDIAAGSCRGARIVGINFEGPYLSPKHGSRRDNVLLPRQEHFQGIVDQAGSLVKIMTVAPELDGARELIRYLNARGIVISIGHSEAGPEDLDFAVHHGARLATHMFCAMGQPHQERKGIKPVGLEERLMGLDQVLAEIIADERGIHVDPFYLKMLLAVKGRDRIILISDSIRMAGTSGGEYAGIDGRVFVHDGDLRIVKETGDVSGSLMTLDQGVRNMMRHTGISLSHALVMATHNPARLLGLDRRKGSIAVGMDADLAVVDEEMNVYLTLVGGEVVYDGLGVGGRQD